MIQKTKYICKGCLMIYTSEKPLLKYFPKVCYCGNTIFHKYTNKNGGESYEKSNEEKN